MVVTRPELRGTHGMVSATHWLAAATGMGILERGGNAFDAAVAAGFVMQVVEPHLNGPGGEVPIVLYSAARDQVLVVNGQGPAPAAATIDHFGGLGLDLVPGTGLLPACVPGAFGAWLALLGEFGTMRLRDVLDAAIGYATDGWPMVAQASATIAAVASFFRQHWPTSAQTWLLEPDGSAPRPGSRVRNPVLAATLRRLLAEAEAAGGDRDAQIEAARAAFYEGFVAEAIAAFATRTEAADTSGEPHKGLLDGADLAAWRATLEPPATFDYHGVTVCKTGPWGQGPVFLQQLALLEGFDLEAMGQGSADYLHTVIECSKLAFADREAWYGDPAFADVPSPTSHSPACSTAATPSAAAPWWASRPPWSCAPARPTAARRACPHRWSAAICCPRPTRASAAGNPRWAPRRRVATPATLTSPTASATWSPPPPAAPGCKAHRPSPSWASASPPGARCSGSPRAYPTPWNPASVPARR